MDSLTPESKKTREMPVDLKEAIRLDSQGLDYLLVDFIEKNGPQQTPFDLPEQYKKTLFNNISAGLSQIESKMDYDTALHRWKIFKDTGLLSAELLQEGIGRHIKDSMMYSKEEVERINKNLNYGHLRTYSPDFIEEFKQDLYKKIQEVLGWDLSK